MRFLEPLVPGRLVRRYKRFLADVRLEDGRVVTAHCPNPGAMTSVAREDTPVWLSHVRSPTRKLAWTWQLAKPRRALVLVNTHLANVVVGEALRRGRLPALAGYDRIRSEAPFPVGPGRVDFRLEAEGRCSCSVEVKSVTLRMEDGTARFPDAVTLRGRRHLEALSAARQQGERAVLLFLVGRADAAPVLPADHVDPAYGDTLRRVAAEGVETLAHRARITTRGVTVGESMPVRTGRIGRRLRPRRGDHRPTRSG